MEVLGLWKKLLKSCENAIAKMRINAKIKAEGGKTMNELSAIDVAEWFLCKQPMTHKKIQKIVYYAYAWYYTLTGQKLFSGEFEAWIHGPVNRQLYGHYAGNGWNAIQASSLPRSKPDSQQEEFLNTVYDVFGGFDADQLESMTHQELPWIEARGGIPANQSSCNIISDETMRRFYGELGRQSQME